MFSNDLQKYNLFLMLGNCCNDFNYPFFMNVYCKFQATKVSKSFIIAFVLLLWAQSSPVFYVYCICHYILPFHGSNFAAKFQCCSLFLLLLHMKDPCSRKSNIWPLQLSHHQHELSRMMRDKAPGSPELHTCSKSKSRFCKITKNLSSK